jgi:hypothetical protein
VQGDENDITLLAIEGLARTHQQMDNYHLALPLYQLQYDTRRTMENARAEDTLLSGLQLASVFEGLHEFERALPLRREGAEGYRQLLGSHHEYTLDAVGRLGQLHSNMGNHTDAAPLLQEAVDGLSALTLLEAHDLHQFEATRQENGTFEPFKYIKRIILPRQARDKHRENSKKCRFLAGSSCTATMNALRTPRRRQITKSSCGGSG